MVVYVFANGCVAQQWLCRVWCYSSSLFSCSRHQSICNDDHQSNPVAGHQLVRYSRTAGGTEPPCAHQPDANYRLLGLDWPTDRCRPTSSSTLTWSDVAEPSGSAYCRHGHVCSARSAGSWHANVSAKSKSLHVSFPFVSPFRLICCVSQ